MNRILTSGTYGARWLQGRYSVSGTSFLLTLAPAVRDSERVLSAVSAAVVSRKRPTLSDADGVAVVALPVTKRWLRQLSVAQNAAELYAFVTQHVQERLVRELWYDLWLAAHNHAARKTVRREKAQNRLFEKNAYRSESIRSAARRSI